MNAHSMPTAAQRPGGDVSSAEGVAADELKQFIERLERLEEEKAGIMGDIKEVFAELKGRGFDAKAVRTILRILIGLTEPVFRPIRKVIPAIAGLDLSPIVVFIAINLVDGLVVGALIRAAGISGALVGL